MCKPVVDNGLLFMRRKAQLALEGLGGLKRVEMPVCHCTVLIYNVVCIPF
jgi:hypothetical protein